jgi:anthranilate phosphoribosyltransferase
VLEKLTNQLKQKRDLSPEQVEVAVENLIDETISPETKAQFLISLNEKGETVAEIEFFAKKLRSYSIHPPIKEEFRNRPIIDVCGTGGDKLGTINISTAVGIIVAAAGVCVAKHGNRALTSKSGSADVLEALGIKIDLSPQQAAEWLERYKFAFLFAPHYHPAFKNIAPARKICAAVGRRTIFNYLGPLLNPAEPNCQIIGVPETSLCEPIASVLQRLGVKRAMVVCGKVFVNTESSQGTVRYIDEISAHGSTVVAEFYQQNAINCSEIDFTELLTSQSKFEELYGGDSSYNATALRGILSGEIRDAKRDIVQLNAAAALFVAQCVNSITDGLELAASLIDSGRALEKLNQLIQAGK